MGQRCFVFRTSKFVLAYHLVRTVDCSPGHSVGLCGAPEERTMARAAYPYVGRNRVFSGLSASRLVSIAESFVSLALLLSRPTDIYRGDLR